MDKKRKRFLAILLIIVLVFTMNIGVNADDSGGSVKTQFDGCSAYFGRADNPNSLMYLLREDIFKPIKYAVPIIFLLLTTIDFAKVVFTDDKEAMNKARKNFLRRALIAVFIFFVPTVLELAFGLFDSVYISNCLSQMAG